jgi:nucleoside triphosphate diphosphatase
MPTPISTMPGGPTGPAETAAALHRLLDTMAALRTPVTGCPWDLEQTFATIAPYTLEEAYEVADAIERGDLVDLEDELGDLLLQVVFHARIAEEQGHFAFADVASAITRKLIRRHPHVFGDGTARIPDEVKRVWSEIKAVERAEKAEAKGLDPAAAPVRRTLDGVPVGLPGLSRAVKLQDKAAGVGFDWPSVRPVLDKVREEIGELEAEIGADIGDGAGPRPGSPEHGRIQAEFGDLLFALANVARHLKIDPEAALRSTNEKFLRRFAAIEDGLRSTGKEPGQATLDEMEQLWVAAKRRE